MPEVIDNTITAKQFESLSSPFVLDLVALFSLMEEDIVKLTRKAQREGWTPDKLIQEISELI